MTFGTVIWIEKLSWNLDCMELNKGEETQYCEKTRNLAIDMRSDTRW